MERESRRRPATESRTARLSTRRGDRRRQALWRLAGGAVALVVVAGLLLAALTSGGKSVAQSGSLEVPVITLDGVVDTAAADYAIRVIGEAESNGAPAVIVQTGTTGGARETALRLTDRITAAKVPVIAWIGPAPATSSSAGTLVFCAADISAIAPGASVDTVIPADARQTRAEVDELTALARTLTEQNGRDPDWAELAVRQPLALDAAGAVSIGAADLAAGSLEELLVRVDGFETRAKALTVDTAGASAVPVSMSLPEKIHHALLMPDTAWPLLLAALVSVVLAMARPGRSIFLAAGLLLPAIYAAFSVPVNYTGAGLLLLGMALASTPIWFRSFGMLPVAGFFCLIASTLFLFPSSAPWLEISLPLTLAGTIGAMVFLQLIARAAPAGSRRPRGARAELVGTTGLTRTRLDPLGQVYIDDRALSAESAGGELIEKGEEVEVVAVSGLILKVRKLI